MRRPPDVGTPRPPVRRSRPGRPARPERPDRQGPPHATNPTVRVAMKRAWQTQTTELLVADAFFDNSRPTRSFAPFRASPPTPARPARPFGSGPRIVTEPTPHATEPGQNPSNCPYL